MKSFAAASLSKLTSDNASIERRIERLKHDPGVALDAKACAYVLEHPSVSYSGALAVAMQEDKKLAAEFAESFGGTPDPANDDAGSIAAGKQLDELALAWQRDHPQSKYDQALKAVMDGHPDLVTLWLKKYSAGNVHTPDTTVHVVEHDSHDDQEPADKQVDRLAMKMHREHPSLSYESCVARVLEANPELKKRYAANK